ncbi:YtxH domain-containing protein [Jiulongibacter sp. NS-SX5]|uniref:YtxH domain-containing protein n=1 Tax=Jiulongibacter sp. NS-SX5 TaxID=3463854 RepID=UPI0040586576
MNTTKAITGMIAAAAAGAAIGIAYAPDKGTKTRKKVKRKAEDFSSNVKEVAINAKDQTVTKANELLDQGKKSVDTLVDKISNSAKSVKVA